MELCMSLIKDELPFESQLLHAEELPMTKRFAFLRGETHLDPGYVYLTTAEDLPEDVICEYGSSLICIGEPPRAFRFKKIPVLVVPEDIDIFQLANELGLVFQKYDVLEDQMNKMLQEGKGLQEMAEFMCPFFMNEITIVDAGHRYQAHAYFSRNSHEDPTVVTLEGKEMVPIEIISFFSNNKRWVEVRTETEPFIYDEGILDFRLLCINIMEEGNFAWRVMLNETDHEFRPYDVHLLTFFAKYVQKVYDRSLAGTDLENIDKLKDLFYLLLSGGHVEAWRIKHALLVAGHPENSRFLCVSIRPKSWDDSTESLAYYSLNVGKMFPGVVTIEFRGDIVCLVGLTPYESSAERFTEAITPFIRDNNFRVGISEVFDDALRSENHYRQADIALSYGIAEEPSKWVHRFHEQAVSYMVRYIGEHLGIETLCAECVLRLRAYDKENDSTYIKTMESYFSNHLNISRTAKALNIHRATMIYRLNRIEELSGIDFQNAEKNLYYQLSVKLLELMGG